MTYSEPMETGTHMATNPPVGKAHTMETAAIKLANDTLDDATMDRVLWAIQDADEPATPSTIARWAKTTTSNARVAINALVDMGLIHGIGNGAWRKFHA